MINGKPLSKCLEELREFKANVKEKDMGKKSYDYIPIEDFVVAFNTVFGAEHYSIDYSELTYHKIASGQDMLTVKCTITLIGDDGFPILHKDGYGGEDFSYQKENGRDGNLKNAPHNATTSAFKNAAKWFNAFGFYTAKGKDGSAKTDSKSSDKKPANRKPEVNISVNTVDGFFSGGLENGTKKDIWKVRATLASDKSDCEVIFYPNQYGKDEKTFNALREMADRKSVSMRITVTDCGEREGVKQFVFKEYCRAA